MASVWRLRIASALTATLAFACGASIDSSGQAPSQSASAQTSAQTTAQPVAKPAPAANTGKPAGPAFIVDFTKGFDGETQYLSNFDSDAGWLLAAYRSANVAFDAKGMTLTARKTPGEQIPYTSAEFQRTGNYGYGRYEVVMRASNAAGLVSSFFTYTGEYFGDPHDEVDFEFLGRTPRWVHLNYFHGESNDPVDIELGFDASKGEHLYAFEWRPDSIRWFIDGKQVREVRAATAKTPIPSASGKVIANAWVATRNSVEWVGEPRFEQTTAHYTCMSHIPTGKTGKQCSDSFKPPLP